MNEETYAITPYGLLSMQIGEAAARQAIDTIELYLRRHHGVPSGVILTEDGFIFSRLAEGKE